MELDEKEAYIAMVIFQNEYYKRTGSDDIGELLGDMQFLEDGRTMDPAAWQDWLDSVVKIKNK